MGVPGCARILLLQQTVRLWRAAGLRACDRGLLRPNVCNRVQAVGQLRVASKANSSRAFSRAQSSVVDNITLQRSTGDLDLSLHPAVAATLTDNGRQSAGKTPFAIVPADGAFDPTVVRHSIRTHVNDLRRSTEVRAAPRKLSRGVLDLTASGWHPPIVEQVRRCRNDASVYYCMVSCGLACQARKFGRASTFLEGEAPLWATSIEDLTVLGPGVGMYFWMLVRGFMLIVGSGGARRRRCCGDCVTAAGMALSTLGLVFGGVWRPPFASPCHSALYCALMRVVFAPGSHSESPVHLLPPHDAHLDPCHDLRVPRQAHRRQ